MRQAPARYGDCRMTEPSLVAVAEWPDYLDAVEAAAVTLEQQVLTGATARVPLIVQPQGEVPGHLAERRDAVAAAVARVEALVAQHQGDITRRLAATSRPTSHPDDPTGHQLGWTLDIMG